MECGGEDGEGKSDGRLTPTMANPFKDWTAADVERWNKKHEANRLPPSPVPKPAVCDGALAKAGGEAKDAGRISVHVKSYRSRLIDPDNLCAKWFVDCLRYCGLLRDDTAKDITFSISQEKVKKGEERTEIEIIPFK